MDKITEDYIKSLYGIVINEDLTSPSSTTQSTDDKGITYKIKSDDIDKIQSKIKKGDTIELEENKDNDKSYNIYAICTKSVGRENKEKYEACIKSLKSKKGYKLGEETKEINEDSNLINGPDLSKMPIDVQNFLKNFDKYLLQYWKKLNTDQEKSMAIQQIFLKIGMPISKLPEILKNANNVAKSNSSSSTTTPSNGTGAFGVGESTKKRKTIKEFKDSLKNKNKKVNIVEKVGEFKKNILK